MIAFKYAIIWINKKIKIKVYILNLLIKNNCKQITFNDSRAVEYITCISKLYKHTTFIFFPIRKKKNKPTVLKLTWNNTSDVKV